MTEHPSPDEFRKHGHDWHLIHQEEVRIGRFDSPGWRLTWACACGEAKTTEVKRR